MAVHGNKTKRSVHKNNDNKNKNDKKKGKGKAANFGGKQAPPFKKKGK